MVAGVRGAADVQADQIAGTPQLLIRVDREAVARWGLNVEDVQAVIRAAVGGESAGQVFEGVRRFEIVVRYPQSSRDTPEAIGNILVPTPDGATVPIAQLARWRRSSVRARSPAKTASVSSPSSATWSIATSAPSLPRHDGPSTTRSTCPPVIW